MRTQVHNINMQVGAGIPPIVKVSQYDELRVIGFRLFDGARAYFPGEDDVVTITGTKPSGLGFTEECSVNGSLAVVETTLAMTQESGYINAELRISDGSTNIGTANFTLYVEPAPHPEGTTDGTTEEARTVLEQCAQYAQEAHEAASDVAPQVEELVNAAVADKMDEIEDAVQSVTDAATQAVSDITAAGEAVEESLPEDYSDLSKDVDKIRADFGSVINLGETPLESTVTIGKRVRADTGALMNSEIRGATGYVDISSYKQIRYARIAETESQSDQTIGIAFYDSNKVFVSGSGICMLVNQQTSEYVDSVVDVPKQATYARFSTFADTDTYGEFYAYGITESVAAIKGLERDNWNEVYEITANDSVSVSNKYIDNTAKWHNSTASTASYLFSVEWSKIRIEANDNFPTFYALLESIPSSYSVNVPFIEGEFERHTIVKGNVAEIKIEAPCYLYIYNITQGGDVYFPDRISVSKVVDKTLEIEGCPADAKETGERIRKLEANTQAIETIMLNYYPESVTSESIDEYGMVEPSSSYKTTDFVEIPHKYNKNMLYTHAYSESGYAPIIAFYGSDKGYLGRSTDAQPVINIDTYFYVRAVYPATDSKCMLAFTNEYITPDYDPPKKYILYQNDLNSYDKNVISDGAITAIINTGLAYLGDERWGYGTEHTAFAESCIKTTKDTHTSSSGYSGERYQMDCSTYVLLMMMGITPECSRYFHTKNIPSQRGYRFNRLVEYEGYVYGVAQSGNTKRMYANTIAEYAYKNGFLFLVNDDMSNLRAGDIFFLSNQGSSYHFFEDIGHCGMIIDTAPMESGGQTIVTFEGNGGSASPCKYHVYSTIRSKMVYAARFPMPYVTNVAKQISNFNTPITTAISGSADDAIDIAEIQLTESLKTAQVYTVYVKCELPDNCYLQLKTNGMTHLGVANGNLINRPDGYKAFRIFAKKDDVLTIADKIVLQAKCTGSVNGNAVLAKAEVYDGFVTSNFG